MGWPGFCWPLLISRSLIKYGGCCMAVLLTDCFPFIVAYIVLLMF